MSKITVKEFQLDSGEKFYAEVYEVGEELNGRRIENAANLADEIQNFEKGLDNLQPAMTAIVDKLKNLSPDNVEVKFGVKLSGKLGALFATTSAEANFEVVLKWEVKQNK